MPETLGTHALRIDEGVFRAAAMDHAVSQCLSEGLIECRDTRKKRIAAYRETSNLVESCDGTYHSEGSRNICFDIEVRAGVLRRTIQRARLHVDFHSDTDLHRTALFICTLQVRASGSWLRGLHRNPSFGSGFRALGTTWSLQARVTAGFWALLCLPFLGLHAGQERLHV